MRKILFIIVLTILGFFAITNHLDGQKKTDDIIDEGAENNHSDTGANRAQSSKDRNENLVKVRSMSLKELSELSCDEILSKLSEAQASGGIGEMEIGLLEEISRRSDIETTLKATLFNKYLGDDRMEKASSTYVNAVDEMLWRDPTGANVLIFLGHLNASSLKDGAYAAFFNKYVKTAEDLRVMMPHIVAHKESQYVLEDANLANRLSRIVRRVLELNPTETENVREVINQYPLTDITKHLMNENMKRRKVDIQF